MAITHAIIPAAGYGTRFLPLTKSVPKEMLPLIEKPAIQHIVEECDKAGIHTINLVISPGKEAIAQYFKPDAQLDAILKSKGKETIVTQLNTLIANNTFNTIYQYEARGLGHAVNCAKEHVTGDSTAILLPDDIIMSEKPAITQLITTHEKYNASVLAIKKVPREATSAYGVIKINTQLDDRTFSVADLVEKPKPEDAPSHYAIVGRYILSNHIFNALDTITPGAGGELQLTDAIKQLIKDGHPVVAYEIDGDRYDTGNPEGWLKAVNAYAQIHTF